MSLSTSFACMQCCDLSHRSTYRMFEAQHTSGRPYLSHQVTSGQTWVNLATATRYSGTSMRCTHASSHASLPSCKARCIWPSFSKIHVTAALCALPAATAAASAQLPTTTPLTLRSCAAMCLLPSHRHLHPDHTTHSVSSKTSSSLCYPSIPSLFEQGQFTRQ